MRVNLEGQVAVVTGAAQGIGQAIADALATNGARVVFSDINEAKVIDAASQHEHCTGTMLDVTDEEQINAVTQRVLDEFGRLDIWVNNAGINSVKERETIEEYPREVWDQIIQVDLTGLYLASRAAAKIMVPQKSGRIINIASVAGLVPLRLQSAFVAAKAGVVNLTKSMAIELGGQGVLVNGIAPGSIMTEATRGLFYGEGGTFKASVQQLLDHIPLARPGTPEEIAHAALFLAAPESSYINGHILVVDGGWTAGYSRDF
jgi:NAD(P)-dependent dehydrogenase (short-subunit alcohol dehydrogenase family)